jgi:hypothetical protein
MTSPPDKHLIDTNVLLVASAADNGSPFPPDATPVNESELRDIVLSWLREFQISGRRMILDFEWKIVAEYRGDNRRLKLTEQDYGMQVVLHKHSTGQLDYVQLTWDHNNDAVIPHAALQAIVHDTADRKMVAAVLAAGGSSNGCNLINACDTDWYDWEEALVSAGIHVHQLIGEEWCRPRWELKHK